jgi:hypothetical protein
VRKGESEGEGERESERERERERERVCVCVCLLLCCAGVPVRCFHTNVDKHRGTSYSSRRIMLFPTFIHYNGELRPYNKIKNTVFKQQMLHTTKPTFSMLRKEMPRPGHLNACCGNLTQTSLTTSSTGSP